MCLYFSKSSDFRQKVLEGKTNPNQRSSLIHKIYTAVYDAHLSQTVSGTIIFVAYNKKDHFYHRAKEENYAARSIYKLEEIDQRFRIIKPKMKVLDLGAAPGSWSQYLSQKIGSEGKLLGVDLERIALTLPNATFIHADLRDLNLEQIFSEHGFPPPFDGVFSDMAPKTTGIRATDQARSLELCELALDIGRRFLRPGGVFVVKLFHSEDFENYRKQIAQSFQKVEVLRPKSTRKESKEVFLIGIGFKPAASKV